MALAGLISLTMATVPCLINRGPVALEKPNTSPESMRALMAARLALTTSTRPSMAPSPFDVVPRAPALIPTGVLTRSLWGGTLSERNQPLGWSPPVPTTLITNFTSAKRGALLGGGTVYLLIGLASVLVYGSSTYLVLLPNGDDVILDAVHSDLNQTVALTGAGLLQQFLPPPAASTDYAFATINLSALDEGSYDTLSKRSGSIQLCSGFPPTTMHWRYGLLP
jgi:hypothetical protein